MHLDRFPVHRAMPDTGGRQTESKHPRDNNFPHTRLHPMSIMS